MKETPKLKLDFVQIVDIHDKCQSNNFTARCEDCPLLMDIDLHRDIKSAYGMTMCYRYLVDQLIRIVVEEREQYAVERAAWMTELNADMQEDDVEVEMSWKEIAEEYRTMYETAAEDATNSLVAALLDTYRQNGVDQLVKLLETFAKKQED